MNGIGPHADITPYVMLGLVMIALAIVVLSVWWSSTHDHGKG